MIFFFKVLCLKTTLLDKIFCHFDPYPAAWACPTFFPVVTLLSWWLWWLGNGCCWYKYSQLQRFIHSLQSQPSLQWSQWQLNGVTHHEGNTRKTFAMSYELPCHLITKLQVLEAQRSDGEAGGRVKNQIQIPLYRKSWGMTLRFEKFEFTSSKHIKLMSHVML